MAKKLGVSRGEFEEHIRVADSGFNRLGRLEADILGDEATGRKSMRSMVEKTASQMDFIVNTMSVNGSRGMEGILTGHYKDIQSLKDSVGSNNTAIGVLMEVTKKDRLRFDLKKKFKEYRMVSPLLMALFSIIRSKEFLIMAGIMIFIILFGADAWYHVKEILP